MTLYDCGSLCKIFRINQSKYKTREEEIEQTKKTNSVWLSVVGRQGLVFHSIGGKHTATPFILPFHRQYQIQIHRDTNTWGYKYKYLANMQPHTSSASLSRDQYKLMLANAFCPNKTPSLKIGPFLLYNVTTMGT